ncbi:MAG TPA: cyclic nucleotide-binding domain-containing protein [Desulfomicrobiaceae bacterium]|nr:cyclic nucleotide-binding domain-containing protein [Desulfomicrobiaceae bacterium]
MQSKRFSIFDNVSEELVEKIKQATTTRTYSKGEVIYDRDEPAENLFFMISGQANVMIKTEDELSVTMGKYKPGYYFGWSALQPAQRYQHRALCIMDCEVGFISGETLRSIMEREPALSFPLMRNILAMHKDRLDLRTDQLIKAITSHPDLDRI